MIFSCNVVSRWAQLGTFLNCLQDSDLQRWIAAFKNWSFISCGEFHCDSAKIKTMINSSLFFLRQCESLDWRDCLDVLLLPATHFRKSGHAHLIRGVFLIFTVFSARRFLFSPPPPSPPLPTPVDSPHLLLSSESLTWRFREQIGRSKKTPALTAGYSKPFRIISVFIHSRALYRPLLLRCSRWSSGHRYFGV